MKFRLTTIFLLTILVNNSFSQKKIQLNENNVKTAIREIDITNKFLVEEVKKIIKSKKNKDSVFKTKGYIRINVKGGGVYNNIPISYKYYINNDYHSFDDISNQDIFPDYYTFINGKPILIFSDVYDKIFKKTFLDESILSFQSIIEPYLFEKKEIDKVQFENKELVTNHRNKYPFRPKELIQVHGGITIYFPVDGGIMPIVVKNIY
ncbi:hypothetical protein EZJ43_09175 [Pedobacter changchengzhani]|uniref:Uncharacterized protein n=1 Tax=Pedobacter changchengzhani TaxID=2529274 RepID=A0A4R5MKC7_9SPHI|nr:hypothetical protein [Pedobacter changchengzhani]TDG36167.1 hypothetical protein EZJ43_09175 [Pedobacter changchengzhani]